MRVCVVGAGLAGLAAGVDLARRGIDVVVLEARDRVGGRVWSQTVATASGDVVIERGAEFVLDGYDHLRQRAGEFGLGVVDTGMSYYQRDVPGLAPEELRDAGQQLMRAAQHSPTGTSVAAVIRHLDVPTDVAEALLGRVEISCAAAADELDAAVVSHVASFSTRPSYRIAGGNQRLAEAMATELGSRVQLSRPVRAILHGDAEVVIRTDAGDEIADRVVVAVPAPILPTLAFEPALPALTEAYGALAYGHAAKLHVPLQQRPAPSAVMSVRHRFWTWTLSEVAGGAGALVHAFAGSPAALGHLAVEEGPDRWAQHLAELRHDLEPLPDQAIFTTWTDDPWACGAYSAWAVGRGIHNRRLFGPAGRVHLAGEHTAGEWSGLMEGALRSGARVADEVAASAG